MEVSRPWILELQPKEQPSVPEADFGMVDGRIVPKQSLYPFRPDGPAFNISLFIIHNHNLSLTLTMLVAMRRYC